MVESAPPAAALEGVRVLDLTANHAAYAGRLLADLGADVIRVEPPEGSPVRRLPPRGASDGTGGFAHAFLDAGKRSVMLDPNVEADRARFLDLAATSDIVFHAPLDASVTAFPIEQLRERNPRLILASISPFGLNGPRAGDVASDLTILAAGGLLSLGGYRDSEPIGIQGEQAHLASGIFAAAAALAALYAREHTNEGVWLDISGQECVAFALEDAVPEWYIASRVRRRLGDEAREAGTGIYPCRDGHISMVAGRLGTAKAFTALTRWIAESNVPGAASLLEPQWQDFRYRQSPEGIKRFAEIFGAFCRTRDKQQLYREGQARQIAIAPVNTLSDVFDDAQLLSRGFFNGPFASESGEHASYPGAPYRLSRTPARMRFPAPRLGEHNGTILEDMSRVRHASRSESSLV